MLTICISFFFNFHNALIISSIIWFIIPITLCITIALHSIIKSTWFCKYDWHYTPCTKEYDNGYISGYCPVCKQKLEYNRERDIWKSV